MVGRGARSVQLAGVPVCRTSLMLCHWFNTCQHSEVSGWWRPAACGCQPEDEGGSEMGAGWGRARCAGHVGVWRFVVAKQLRISIVLISSRTILSLSAA